MTVILCTKDIMIVDHRVTVTENSSRSFSPTEEKFTNKRIHDNIVKLRVRNESCNGFMIEDDPVMAYASAGDSSFKDFIEIYLSIGNGDKQLKDFNKAYNLLFWRTKITASVVFLTKKGNVFKFTYDGNTVINYTRKDRVLTTAGSGSTVVKLATSVLGDLPIEDCFSLAAVYDKHSSPTCSVYLREENTLFAYVEPPIEKLTKRADSLMKKISEKSKNVRKVNTVL